jgi:spermidine synthase
MLWLEREEPPFDAAVVDVPDPNSFALGKLYTTRFYRMLKTRLAPDAAVSVQSTSPLFARNSYWCIVRTLEASGFHVRPYYTAVPSFGVWGFALARRDPFEVPALARVSGLKFLDDGALAAMFMLSADLGPVPVEVNRLDNQSLVRYYEAEWRRYE